MQNALKADSTHIWVNQKTCLCSGMHEEGSRMAWAWVGGWGSGWRDIFVPCKEADDIIGQ